MNFSTTAIAIWLLSLSTTNAFTTNQHTTLYTNQHSPSTQHSTYSSTTSLSMLLKQDKFDTIITNKLSKKELGYDQRSGRFYELNSSKIDGPFASGTATATVEDVEEQGKGVQGSKEERREDEPVTYTDILTKDAQKVPTWQQVDSSSSTSDSSEESTDEPIANSNSNSNNNDSVESTTNIISDIPPMPSSNFKGMDLTGTTINGVQLTSSTETIKSKQTRDAINKQFAIEEEEAAKQDREKKEQEEKSNKNSLQDVITNSGEVSAAAMATAAVNAAGK